MGKGINIGNVTEPCDDPAECGVGFFGAGDRCPVEGCRRIAREVECCERDSCDYCAGFGYAITLQRENPQPTPVADREDSP